MSTRPKRPAADIRPLAEQIVEQLRPHCHRIEIAGSLRRKCEMVGDIEIVCEPIVVKSEMVVERTLFAGRVEPVRENRVDQAVSRLLLTEHWEPRLDKTGRQAIGSRYKRLTVHGVAVDLFSVLQPASWGVIFAIRTGPEAFSRRLVTQRRKRGLLPDHLRVERGTIVFDEGPQSVIPGARTMADGIVVREERDVFALCGLDWIEPEGRK